MARDLNGAWLALGAAVVAVGAGAVMGGKGSRATGAVQVEYACECVNPDDAPMARKLYTVTGHDGKTCVCSYCDDCADLASMDWNDETAAIEPLLPGHAKGQGQGRGSRYRQEDETLEIRSTSGKPYNLRLVPPGGKYGLNRGLTNKGPAMLEFYWPNPKNPSEPFAEGHFTGERYTLPTLVRVSASGLSLQNDKASFNAETMRRALIWALDGIPDGRA